MIGRAKTGTGKTLAFGIPILDKITRHNAKNGYACFYNIRKFYYLSFAARLKSCILFVYCKLTSNCAEFPSSVIPMSSLFYVSLAGLGEILWLWC